MPFLSVLLTTLQYLSITFLTCFYTLFQRKKHKTVKVKENCEDDEPPLIPEVSKDITAPVGTTNATFIPSRPDSMTASIGVDWDFPFIDETPAVSMVSLLIDEQNKIS